MKILIVGGYGTFGGRLARLLSNQSQLTLFIAGRSIKDAQSFCKQLNGTAAQTYPLHFDRDQPEIEAQLRKWMPLVHFNAMGKITDGSNFVKGVSQFDDEAKAKNIFVLSGVSSFPVLTASVIRHLAKDLTHIHSIKGGVAPSPYADVGLNVIRAIASYSGKGICLVRDGQLTIGYAMIDTMRYTICPPGRLPLDNRRFSLVDVPDLQILSDLWPNIDSIWMGAGPTPDIFHRMLNALAWLVQLRIISSLSPFARLFHWSRNRFRWGDHRGGMFVSIEGFDINGEKHQRSWHLLTEGDEGPFIPSMAVQAIVCRTLDGKQPVSGARAATKDLELDQFENLFRNHTIYTGQRELTTDNDPTLPLYKQLLGQAWDELPQSLRTLHSCTNIVRAEGVAQVERGTSLLARCVAIIVGFPNAGHDIPVQVLFKPTLNGELWTRTFSGKTFSSWQTKGRGRSEHLLNERFGPFTVSVALVVDQGKLHLIVRSWNLFGIRLPLSLAPIGSFYEFDDNGRFHFHVEIKHLFTGLIVRYRGWLRTVD